MVELNEAFTWLYSIQNLKIFNDRTYNQSLSEEMHTLIGQMLTITTI